MRERRLCQFSGDVSWQQFVAAIVRVLRDATVAVLRFPRSQLSCRSVNSARSGHDEQKAEPDAKPRLSAPQRAKRLASGRLGRHLAPATGASPDIRVVALRLRAVIPVARARHAAALPRFDVLSRRRVLAV
jgi:hypothetical protein